jgi:hypothetical protein
MWHTYRHSVAALWEAYAFCLHPVDHKSNAYACELLQTSKVLHAAVAAVETYAFAETYAFCGGQALTLVG